MFDKLVDLLTSFANQFTFATVVNQFEGALVLRFGVRHRTLAPGLRFHWPFGIEQVCRHPVIVDTQELGEQSLTTCDDIGITVTGVVTFLVSDVEQVLLHVQGERQALVDSSMGIIGTMILERPWREIITDEFWNEVTKAVRRRAKKYGLEVQTVQFKDLTKGPSLRVWNSTTTAVKAD